MTTPLLYSKQDAIARVTFNRPASRNALTPEMLCRFADAVVDFQADDTLRVMIITGAGDQAFCAGGDLGSGNHTDNSVNTHVSTETETHSNVDNNVDDHSFTSNVASGNSTDIASHNDTDLASHNDSHLGF